MAKKEIAKADLPILKSKVEDLVRQYNAAEKVEETTELDDKIKEAVNDYTCAARTIAFSEIKESPDAMLEAVKRLTYQTIGVKDVRPEGSKVAVREVIDKGRPIDLIKLENFCGHIGAEADWYDQCQKLNFLLTAKKAKDLGIDPREVNDSYAMSEIAKQIDLGDYLLLGKGEDKNGGRERASIVSDAFEAVIAAIYLDGSIDPAREFVLRFVMTAVEEKTITFKDYKTKLQEIIQKNPEEQLQYVLAGESGPDHNKRFEVEVHLNSNVIGRGIGRTKKQAEQEAAREALALMGL